MNTDNELIAIDSADLDTVTGGFWGAAIGFLGGLMGGGTNLSVQNGNGNRSAQGNQGPTSLGDGSPITTAPQTK